MIMKRDKGLKEYINNEPLSKCWSACDWRGDEIAWMGIRINKYVEPYMKSSRINKRHTYINKKDFYNHE